MNTETAWEYRVVYLTHATEQETLNDLGAKGWELVAVLEWSAPYCAKAYLLSPVGIRCHDCTCPQIPAHPPCARGLSQRGTPGTLQRGQTPDKEKGLKRKHSGPR